MGFVVLTKDVQIAHAGAISLGAEDRRPFHRQLDSLLDWLDDELFCVPGTISHVACEMPQFFNTRRGFDTAAGGDLTEMCVCVGLVAAYARYHSAKFTPVPVSQWKGQLQKPVVIERLRKKIDTSLLTSKPSHDWDACGIGLFIKGKF